MSSGENLTLLCSSEHAFDQFHLLREGENLGRPLGGGRGPRRALQAEFPLRPGTPAHSGAYRGYGSFTRSPYAWSDPSDPLHLSQVRIPLPAQLSCCSSVSMLCPTLFAPLDCSTTDSSVLHCLRLMEHSLVLVKGLVLLNEDTSHVMQSHPRQTSHSEDFWQNMVP